MPWPPPVPALTSTYIMGSTSNAVCMPSRAMLLTGRSLFRVFRSKPGRSIPVSDGCGDPDVSAVAARRRVPVLWRRQVAQRTLNLFARSFDAGGSIFFGGMSDHEAVPHCMTLTRDGVYPPEAVSIVDDGFSTEIFVDTAIHGCCIEHPADQPFCMYTAFTSPHDPRTPPAGVRRQMYPPEDIELPPNFARIHPFDNGHLHGRDESLAAHPRDSGDEVRQHIADYYGMISHLDAQIGRLLDALAVFRPGREHDRGLHRRPRPGRRPARPTWASRTSTTTASAFPLLVRGPGHLCRSTARRGCATCTTSSQPSSTSPASR